MICRILQILSFHLRLLSLPSSLPLSFSWVSGAGRSHKPDRSVSLEAKKSAAVGSSMGWTGDIRLVDAWVWSAQLLAVTKCCWRELQLGWVSQKCYHDNRHQLGSKSPTLVYCFINATNVYEFSFRKSSTDPNEHRYLARASSLKKPVVPSIIPHFQRCCVGIHQGQAEPDDVEVVRRATRLHSEIQGIPNWNMLTWQRYSLLIGDSWTWMQSG